MNHQKRQHQMQLKTLVFSLVVLATIFGLIFWSYKHWGKNDTVTLTTNPTTASQSTKGETSNKAANQSATTTDTAKGQPSGVPGVPLILDCNFVSNHHVSLSDVSAAGIEASSCTTTSNAAVKITFARGGITVNLPTKNADKSGGVFWSSWRPIDYKLSTGTWSVSASSTLDGKTIVAEDSSPLEVSQ